jgi:hypothetical protein
MVCVRACWEDILRLDPVILRRRDRQKISYRCRFCARDHEAYSLAAHCAKDCLESSKIRFALELEAWGLSESLADQPLVRPKSTVKKPTLALLPMFKRRPPKEATKDPHAAAQNVPAEALARHDEKQGKAPELGEAGREEKLQPDSKISGGSQSLAAETKAPKEPFSRNGAQYVCNGCQKKYFTKDDVVKCFESHGDG